MPLNDICPVCELPKRIKTVMIGNRPFRAPTSEGHELCRAELERRQAEEVQRAHEEAVLARLNARMEEGFKFSGVAWETKTLLNLRPNKGHVAAVNLLKAWTPGKKGFVLFGSPGTGKTHIMVGLAKMAAERDCLDFAFIKVSPWLDSLRGIEFQALEKSVKHIERIPLLFIDDLGAEKLTEWTESKIERVFDYRFEFSLPTFISTNLEPDALADHLTPRLWSRLRGLSEFLKITGEDFRQAPSGKGKK